MKSFARVLLLNPPFFPRYSRSQRSPGVIKSGTLYYPIWQAYAAGVLQKVGHNVLLLDAPASGIDLDETRDNTKAFGPDLVVIDTSTPSIDNDIKVLRALKSDNPDAVYVLVGTHVSSLAEETMTSNPEVDGVCVMEYDMTLVDLADSIARGVKDQPVPGLLRRHNGRILDGGPRPYLEDLDSLPWVSRVYREFLPIRSYFYSITQYPVLTLITGRGCPHRCLYCVYPQTMHGHKYRVRSPEDVVAEMAYIREEIPYIKEIFFEDDTLTVDKARVMKLCGLLTEKGIKISWTANSRCDVDFETLSAMKKAGCRLLCVGVESGNQEILDNMRKRITLDRVEQFAKDAKRAGLMIHGCFMVGNPGETRETMKETLDFAMRLAFDTAQFFPLMVYPGTEAYRWAKQNDYLTTNDFSRWVDDEGCHNCVINLPGLTAEDLVRFCDQARRRYYLRPRYMAGKSLQILKHPKEFKRVFRAARTLLRYLITRG